MPPLLADPGKWVLPTLEQAQADEVVARHLLSTLVDDFPYNGSPPFDAAVAKLQQSAEKALKASVLALAPGASNLVFYPHRLLGEADLPQSTRFRALLDKISKVHHRPGLRAVLEQLEQYAPAGASLAEIDPVSGAIKGLTLNTEYPFTNAAGICSSPARAWRHRQAHAVELARAVRLLFRILKGLPEFRDALADYPAPAIGV